MLCESAKTEFFYRAVHCNGSCFVYLTDAIALTLLYRRLELEESCPLEAGVTNLGVTRWRESTSGSKYPNIFEGVHLSMILHQELVDRPIHLS
jgi:hypothetical protein